MVPWVGRFLKVGKLAMGAGHPHSNSRFRTSCVSFTRAQRKQHSTKTTTKAENYERSTDATVGRGGRHHQ